MTTSQWRPGRVAFRLLRGAATVLAPARVKHLWHAPPGAADQRARLKAWEYEGGALANEPLK